MWYKPRVTWAVVIAWYGLASAAAFVAFWLDKRRAAAGLWRIPEANLHALELLGGWPGSLAAMKWVRHKNQKASFWLVTALIAAVHVGVWVWLAVRAWRAD